MLNTSLASALQSTDVVKSKVLLLIELFEKPTNETRLNKIIVKIVFFILFNYYFFSNCFDIMELYSSCVIILPFLGFIISFSISPKRIFVAP